MKKVFLLFCFALIFGVIALYAVEPATNIDPARHPNLARAQILISDAYQRILDAQRANEFDMKGHAKKAKIFLEEASKELKLAAVAANHNAETNAPHAVPPENKPGESVAETRIPNLAKAQELIDTAYARILDAQKDNDFDLNGHAAKAKSFIEQASKELKLAAQAATH